jgi:anti-sigma regulatory factor (Ser/Thr protein kinase)
MGLLVGKSKLRGKANQKYFKFRIWNKRYRIRWNLPIITACNPNIQTGDPMKSSRIRTELTLPADVAALPVAQAYVRQLALLAGLSHEEANSLELAVEEACTNSIEHGYYSGEAGTLNLPGDLTPQALCISIWDRGLPFDQSVAPVYRPPADVGLARLSLEGLGLELIKQAVDEVRWVNHGTRGKELRLVKYLNRGDADASRACSAPAKDGGVVHGAQTEPASHEYTIRRMVAEDALRVCQCFFRTFGYSYEEDFYSPDRLVSLNQTGELISVVAVDDGSGEIAGHVALSRPNLCPVGERTHLVVAPEHRGLNLRERMGDFLEGELTRLGVVGTYGLAVTTHTISQKASESRGMRVCGINLGLGMEYNFKGIKSRIRNDGVPPDSETKRSERESLVFYFKYLVPAPRTIVHAPARHWEMLARTYEHLQIPVDFRDAEPATGQGLVTISFLREERLGEIQVRKVGNHSAAEVRRARRDLCEIGGAEVVFLDLPLAQPGTPDLSEAAEKDGFIYSGVQPSFASDGDYLRLVYLDVDLDLSNIQIFSPFGEELLAYIRKEMDGRARAGPR